MIFYNLVMRGCYYQYQSQAPHSDHPQATTWHDIREEEDARICSGINERREGPGRPPSSMPRSQSAMLASPGAEPLGVSL